MKRSEPLIALSREHHGALSLALRARRVAHGGEPASVKSVADLVRQKFETELKPHFDQEENWLLPVLARAGEKFLVQRTLAEHAELTDLADRLASPRPRVLLAFADALSRHVRFEERELFPAIERLPNHAGKVAEKIF